LFPFVDMGPDFFLDELADGPPKLLMLGIKELGPGRGYVCQ
jgi:hypothetical protein